MNGGRRLSVATSYYRTFGMLPNCSALIRLRRSAGAAKEGLSRQQPLPSMLIAISSRFRMLVNWLP